MQAFRELLLAQSSDFAFILRSGTVTAYARARVQGHLAAFLELVRAVRRAAVDPLRLHALEERDDLFPELDARVVPGVRPVRHGAGGRTGPPGLFKDRPRFSSPACAASGAL